MVVSNWSFPWLFQSSFLFRSMRRGREGTSSSDLVTAGTESTVFAPVVSFGFVFPKQVKQAFHGFRMFSLTSSLSRHLHFMIILWTCAACLQLPPLAPFLSSSSLGCLSFLLSLFLCFFSLFLLSPFLSFLKSLGLVFLLASLVGRCTFSHPRLKPSSPFYLDCLDVVCSVCLLTTCLPFVSLLVSVFVSLHAFLVFILFSPCPCLDFECFVRLFTTCLRLITFLLLCFSLLVFLLNFCKDFLKHGGFFPNFLCFDPRNDIQVPQCQRNLDRLVFLGGAGACCQRQKLDFPHVPVSGSEVHAAASICAGTHQ